MRAHVGSQTTGRRERFNQNIDGPASGLLSRKKTTSRFDINLRMIKLVEKRSFFNQKYRRARLGTAVEKKKRRARFDINLRMIKLVEKWSFFSPKISTGPPRDCSSTAAFYSLPRTLCLTKTQMQNNSAHQPLETGRLLPVVNI